MTSNWKLQSQPPFGQADHARASFYGRMNRAKSASWNENRRSLEFAGARLGFVQERVLRKNNHGGEGWDDTALFAILAEDFSPA